MPASLLPNLVVHPTSLHLLPGSPGFRFLPTLASYVVHANALYGVQTNASYAPPACLAQVIPTLVKVVDTTNDSSSGAGWSIGEGGLPKLPVTSVAIVLGVGVIILEAASHAPVLSLFMPRVLSVAGWIAVVGSVLDKRESK